MVTVDKNDELIEETKYVILIGNLLNRRKQLINVSDDVLMIYLHQEKLVL
jgi:hypothetical protein